VRRKLDALLEDERRATHPPDARAALTQGVLEDIFRHASALSRPVHGVIVEDVALHRARKTSIEGVRLVLRRNEERKRVYLESSNSEHGKSAASTIKRLSDVVAADQADVAVLVREEAFPLDRRATSSASVVRSISTRSSRRAIRRRHRSTSCG
jgi:hypothetical protein